MLSGFIIGIAFGLAGLVGCGASSDNPGDIDASMDPDIDAPPGSPDARPFADAAPRGPDASATPSTSIRIIVEPDGDDGSEIVAAIKAATTSVHMTMYLLSDTQTIAALIARHKAGVDVKIVLDQNLPTGSSNQNVYNQLVAAGVAVHWALAQFTYTHEKCFIVDGKEAWIMSMNATNSSPSSNREYLAVDDDMADVTEAETIFEGDYAGTPPSTVSGNLLVSPINSRDKLLTLLSEATSTIDMEAEELSDTPIVSSLGTAAHRGIKVRVVLSNETPSAAQTTAVTSLKASGVQLVTVANPDIHAKSIVVDGTTAYVGSENFTTESLQYNRELGVILAIPSEVQKIITATNTDFSNGTAL